MYSLAWQTYTQKIWPQNSANLPIRIKFSREPCNDLFLCFYFPIYWCASPSFIYSSTEVSVSFCHVACCREAREEFERLSTQEWFSQMPVVLYFISNFKSRSSQQNTKKEKKEKEKIKQNIMQKLIQLIPVLKHKEKKNAVSSKTWPKQCPVAHPQYKTVCLTSDKQMQTLASYTECPKHTQTMD